MKVKIAWSDGTSQEEEVDGYRVFDSGMIEVYHKNKSVTYISPYNYLSFVEDNSLIGSKKNE